MNAIDIATRSIEDIDCQISRVEKSILRLADDYIDHRMSSASYRRELTILKSELTAYEHCRNTIMQHLSNYKMTNAYEQRGVPLYTDNTET